MPGAIRFRVSRSRRRRGRCARLIGDLREGEDGAVGVSELWLVDLPFKEDDLVAEREDLRIAGVAFGEDPSESVNKKANQSGQKGNERRRLAARVMAKTR